MLRHATGSIKQLVGAVTLGKPRPFGVTVLVFLVLLAFVHRRCAESLFRHVKHSQFTRVADHVAVQLQIINAWITPHQPGLAVVVNHHRGVYVIPAAILEQRLSDGITERADR